MPDRPILFDVDGVVVHGFHAVAEKRRRWDENVLRDLGIEPDKFAEVFIHGPFERDVLSGRLSLIQALADAAPAFGFDGSPMRLADYWLLRDSQVNFQLLDLVRELRLAGARRIYLATNQEHLRAFHLWSNVGLKAYFDDIFYAARLGALKPSSEFFEKIERSLGRQTESPLFFDDSEAAVRAACAFGWEGVLFESTESCSRHPWIERLFARRRAPRSPATTRIPLTPLAGS